MKRLKIVDERNPTVGHVINVLGRASADLIVVGAIREARDQAKNAKPEIMQPFLRAFFWTTRFSTSARFATSQQERYTMR